MLLASVWTSLGIHQRKPATSPPSLRSEKIDDSFSTRAAASWVDVTQTLPTSGNFVATAAPDARNFETTLEGSRRKASLAKSTTIIGHLCCQPDAKMVPRKIGCKGLRDDVRLTEKRRSSPEATSRYRE